jgi:hypothetical protein
MAIGTACSQGDPQPPFIPDPPKQDATVSTGDASGNDAAKPTCGTDDGGCNTLANCGSKVYTVDVAQNGPAGIGGTVLDGTYVLTDHRVFTGSGGQSGATQSYISETMTLTTVATGDGGTSEAGAEAGAEGGAPPQTMVWEDIIASTANPQSVAASGVAQFSGSSLMITHTCPNANILPGTFTVSNTQLLFFVQDGPGVGQLTYTKQ